MELRHSGYLASNKPHPAEKSTPVWLAIWRTWAGFANSQLLPDAAPLSSMQGLQRSGNSSAQTSASLHPPPRRSRQQQPHPAENSTTVWPAIWRTCAGFANLQLRCATLHSTYSYMYPSTLLPPWNSCSDIANLSAHLHRLPTPPPYLRRIRLSPGRTQVLSAG